MPARGQHEEAVDVCRAGLDIHPAYLSARVTLGRALIELNQLDDAQTELEFVLKSAPENLAAIRGLAEIHHRRGSLVEALAQYRAALAARPQRSGFGAHRRRARARRRAAEAAGGRRTACRSSRCSRSFSRTSRRLRPRRRPSSSTRLRPLQTIRSSPRSARHWKRPPYDGQDASRGAAGAGRTTLH